MNARKILNNIHVLRATQDKSISISNIAANCSSSRSTVRRFIRDCENWDVVRRSDDGYTLTMAGDLILREYDKLDDDKQAGLVALTNSNKKKFDILQTIKDCPADKAELAKKSGTSRSTVHRIIDDFSEWFNEENGNIELSRFGGDLLETYREFTEKTNVVEGQTEFLKRYQDEDSGVQIPLEALAESRQVVSTMNDRQKVVREVNDMDSGDAELLRAVSHSFSSQISDESYAELTPEVDAELIVDRSVYEVITNPRQWKYLLRSRHYPNFRILVLPEDVTIALAINGSEEAVITACSEDYPLHVGLFGESEAFMKWAMRLYEYFRINANHIPKDLIKWAASAT